MPVIKIKILFDCKQLFLHLFNFACSVKTDRKAKIKLIHVFTICNFDKRDII